MHDKLLFNISRLLTGRFIPVGSAIFGATFSLVTRVIIIEKLTDGSPKNYSIPLNICFSYRNLLQNGVKALSKMVLEYSVFLF